MKWLLKGIIGIVLLMAICVSSSIACPTDCLSGYQTKTVVQHQSVTLTMTNARETGVTYTWTLLDKDSPHNPIWSQPVPTTAPYTYTFTAPDVPGTYYLELVASKDGYTGCVVVKCTWLVVDSLTCPQTTATYCYGLTPNFGTTGYSLPSGVTGLTWLWSYKYNNVWVPDGTGATPTLVWPLTWQTLPVGSYDLQLEIKNGNTVIKTCTLPGAITVVAKPLPPSFTTN
jgi:hypothetical protein